MGQLNHFYIRLLGPVQVEKNDQPVQGFESRKALALLGYLISQNHPVSRSKLVGLFWGGKSETRGRGNLRRVLHNLKEHLPDCLEADRYMIGLKRSPACRSDLEMFSRWEGESSLSAKVQAAELFRGDFMEGIYLDDCPEFETWLITEQERWRQRVVQLLDSLVREYRYRGEYNHAVKLAQRLLTLTPWRESVHRQLMTLFARNGQRGEALRQYQFCQQLLEEEFGVEPTEETIHLFQRIGAAEKRPRFDLSSPVTPFVGRKNELAEISRTLASPDCRLLTLVGLGGMGKTRLALQYAHQNQDTYLDGVAFVPLAALDDSSRVVTALAQALDLAIGATPDPRQQLFDYLGDKETLLVLDNFEHLLEAATLVSDLLNQAPMVKLLVTSRQRLNLQGEWVYPLEGLSLQPATETDLSSLEAPSEAVSLFIQRARQTILHFQPDSNVETICRLLEGLPLGIELSAALVPHLSCRKIAETLETNLDDLTSPLRDIPERHRSLSVIFDQTWQMLSERERQAFKRLSVFRGGFSNQAASKIAEANTAILGNLVDKSLLRPSSKDHYDLHEMLRQYAAEKLDPYPDEKERLRSRHAAYYLGIMPRWAEGHTVTNGPSIPPAAFEKIAGEIDNICVAWNWALKNGHVALLSEAVDLLGKYHEVRSWYTDGKKMFETALKEVGRLKTEGKHPSLGLVKAILLKWLGEYKYDLGLFDQARENLQESAALFREREEDHQQAWTLLPLGKVMLTQSDFAAAEESFAQSLQLFEEHDNIRGAAVCLEFLGTTASIQGDYSKAQANYQKSLDRYRQSKDSYGMAGGLYCLGDLARITGEYDRAREHILESLEIYRRIKSQRGEAQALDQLGTVYRLSDQVEEALQYHRQSLKLRQAIGEQDGIALSLTNLGRDALEQGDFFQAKHYCQEGVTLFEQTNHKRKLVVALTHLGRAYQAAGDHRQAKATLSQALALVAEIRSLPQVMEVLVAIGEYLADRGNTIQALKVVAHSLRNPATYMEVQEQARGLAARLKADLPTGAAEQILAQEQQRDWAELVAEFNNLD
jgi:predicted ATPase/DNA-binding SARP family transcriptional activator/uncharacterized protein HemY